MCLYKLARKMRLWVIAMFSRAQSDIIGLVSSSSSVRQRCRDKQSSLFVAGRYIFIHSYSLASLSTQGYLQCKTYAGLPGCASFILAMLVASASNSVCTYNMFISKSRRSMLNMKLFSRVMPVWTPH